MVPRLVEGMAHATWHICLADYRFEEAAIVTLAALCEEWCYGRLSRLSMEEFQLRFPEFSICARCLEELAVLREIAFKAD